jgi:type II secretory pathway pseudopilin PulG
MRARRSIRSESGFTIVEVMVAALILVIGAAALMTALAGARKATYRGEQSQVANDIAQREMETLRATPYTKLAMTSTPGHSTDQSDPRYRVSSGNFALGRDGSNPAPMVVNGGTLVKGGTVSGGTVNPGPEPFTSGDVSGTIQRFVVWQNDPRCQDVLCPGSQDFKRAVVLVTLDTTASGGVRQYVELQSDAINPTDSVGSNPNLPQLGTPTVAQQFWLSDRRCEQYTEPARTATNVASNHPTRDTRGLNCLDTTADRPDALLTSAPDELLDIVDNLDYSTDLEPTPPDADAGLQLDLPAANGCNLLPASRPANQEHFWVSQPVNKNGSYVLKGGTTLKLFTRTINDVQVSGKLCVVVFVRTQTYATSTTTVPTTTDVQLAAGSVSKPNWASGEWEELTIPMQFTPSTIQPVSSTFPKDYQRIGVVIGLDKQGGASNQFQFQYDTVRFDSRLEVETTTPIG